MSAVGMMRQTCVIYRPTVTKSSIASASESFVVVASGVQCAIQMNSTREGVEYQKLTGRRLALGYFPVSTDLRGRDRTIWRGIQWEVRGEPINEVNRNSHLVADLEELDSSRAFVDSTGQWDWSSADNSGVMVGTWE